MQTLKHHEDGHRQIKTIYISRARDQLALLHSVEDFPLHAVLKLAAPQHQVEDFQDGVLRIFLQRDKDKRAYLQNAELNLTRKAPDFF